MGLFGGGSGLFGGGSSLGGLFSGGSSSGHGSFSGGLTSSVIRDPHKDTDIVREAIKESDTLLGEFYRTVDDAKEEFHELCTDGFVEMVIKGNKDYKTSQEIKDEANKKIGDARYRYQERCYEFNKYLESLNNLINNLYQKKVELAQKFNQNIESMQNLPNISSSSNSPSYSYKRSSISMICEYSGLGKTFDIKGKKESANAYLEDAKDFEVEISGKIAEINRIEAFLKTIQLNLEEEETLINALNDSLINKSNENSNQILEQLKILISEYILDSDGKRNEKYIEAINILKKFQ